MNTQTKFQRTQRKPGSEKPSEPQEKTAPIVPLDLLGMDWYKPPIRRTVGQSKEEIKTAEKPTSVRNSLEKQAERENKQEIKTVEKPMSVRNSVEKKAQRNGINTSMEAAIQTKSLKTNVLEKPSSQVAYKIKSQVKNQIKRQIKSQVKNQIKNQIKNQAKNQIKNQIKRQIKSQAKNQIKNQIKNQAKNQSKRQIKSQVLSKQQEFKNLKRIYPLFSVLMKKIDRVKKQNWMNIKRYVMFFTQKEKQARIFCFSLAELSTRVDIYPVRQVFHLIKSISTKKNKENFKDDLTLISTKQKSILPTVIHSLFINNALVVMAALKTKSMIKLSSLETGLKCLTDSLWRKKLKESLIRIKASKNIKQIFSKADKICRSVLKVSVKNGFYRIFKESLKNIKSILVHKSVSSPKSSSSPSKFKFQSSHKVPNSSITRQSDLINNLKNQIDKISSSVKEKRFTFDKQKAFNKKSLQQLKIIFSKVVEEVNSKKEINESLKSRLQSFEIPSTSQMEIDLTDFDQESGLNILEELYSQVSKMTEQEFASNIDLILINYKIQQSKNNKLVKQWAAITHREHLKAEISNVQKNLFNLTPQPQNKAPLEQMLLSQNQMIRNLIRSYVKERYLWREVKRCVSPL